MIEHRGFLLLLTAVTLAFAWVLYPFYGAVLWAVVVAVLFAPVYRRLLQSMQDRPSLAAALTVLIIIAIVILPLAIVATSLAQEASGLIAKIQSGEYNLGSYVQRILDALPAWATGLIERFNLTDLLGPSRKAHVRPDDGRTDSRPAGAQHRDEHVRIRDPPRHHALSAVLPVA